MSWVRLCSYKRLVRVTFLSSAGVEDVEEGPAEGGYQSLSEGATCDVIDVAAVELRAMADADDVVEDVSRLLLYPGGRGDSGRPSSPSAS